MTTAMEQHEPSGAANELAARVRTFVEKSVLPLETALGRREPRDEDLAPLRAEAKRLSLWAPQLPVDLGGQGLHILDAAPALEAAGRSLLGPLSLGCSAPDEGNAHLLHLAASDAQRRRYLEPLAAGDIRSTFCMTEPAPGAGSDPRMMQTEAHADGDDWIIDGDKWFSTGARGATFVIVAAVTDPSADRRSGVSLFLVDADNPGFEIVREIETLGGGTPGGHCEVRFKNCRVRATDRLGELHQGYRLLQARLVPARLTHCMRWLGVAERAREIATDYVQNREAFGKAIAEHQGAAWMLADSHIELHAARLMVRHAAARLVAGDRARVESSMCKVFVAEAVGRVVDRALQLCGAKGVSTDLPLAAFYEEVRAFRVYDGPTEVHRMVVARELLGRGG